MAKRIMHISWNSSPVGIARAERMFCGKFRPIAYVGDGADSWRHKDELNTDIGAFDHEVFALCEDCTLLFLVSKL